MKLQFFAFAVLAALCAGLVAMSGQTSRVAAQEQSPGMCNGRSDANVALNAHANGASSAQKYILNVESDTLGDITGVLTLGQGRDRLQVTDWCRLWQHLPGQPFGTCEEESDHGTVNLHAVGIATLRDGTKVLVRTDIRESDEGKFFRVRYKTIGEHSEGDEGDSCEDEAWTRVPDEGWLPLTQLLVRSAG